MAINPAGYIGDFADNETEMTFYFSTSNSVAMVAFDTDPTGVTVVKYTGAAQATRAEGSAYTADTPGVGQHRIIIDLNSHAFYEVGANYTVYLDDGVLGAYNSARTIIGSFSIENKTIGFASPVAVESIRDGVIADNTTFNGADIATIKTDVAAILVDTGTTLPAAMVTTAQVNTEVVDVLRTDTISEITSVPAATPGLHSMVQWLYQDCRNKQTVTATTHLKFADDGSTTVSTTTISDDGTTFTKGEEV